MRALLLPTVVTAAAFGVPPLRGQPACAPQPCVCVCSGGAPAAVPAAPAEGSSGPTAAPLLAPTTSAPSASPGRLRWYGGPGAVIDAASFALMLGAASSNGA